MMSTVQAKNIVYLVDRFLESEKKGWNQLDDYLCILDELDDLQIFREADTLYSYHKNKKMGCPYTHSEGTICFVNGILEAVEAITDLYKETNSLHQNNRYILAYYLSLSHDRQICELPESSAI